jgi:predicted house-cleaning NTP pyrophosphatase (Maf/HAM1 superfamily)
MDIILGSASKKRRIILDEAGIHVDTVLIADLDEKAIRDPDHARLVMNLARAKRDALLPRITQPAFLITADTVLYEGVNLLEKPTSIEEEYRFFDSYDGKKICGFVTGITVTNTATGETREGTEDGEFIMGPFTKEFIDAWIAVGEYMQYAGGFTYMDPRFAKSYVPIRGGEDNLMGMPVALVKRFLTELGWVSAQ